MITRADIAGALKVLNATNSTNRRAAIEAMLTAEHPEREVKRALRDLENYPGWIARAELDAPPAAPVESAIPAPVKRIPKTPAPVKPKPAKPKTVKPKKAAKK